MQKCFSHSEAAILKFVLPIRAHGNFSPRQKNNVVNLKKNYGDRIHRIHKWPPRGMVWNLAHEIEVGKARVMFT